MDAPARRRIKLGLIQKNPEAVHLNTVETIHPSWLRTACGRTLKRIGRIRLFGSGLTKKAPPDAESATQAGGQIMASGWARDGAVQDQIDASVEDAVKRARSELPHGESLGQCVECAADIPEARRLAVPGVRLCIHCQTELDNQRTAHSGYNRRGSKDSQLR